MYMYIYYILLFSEAILVNKNYNLTIIRIIRKMKKKKK